MYPGEWRSDLKLLTPRQSTMLGKPKLDHAGMPDHLFNAFLDADLMTMQEWEAFLNEAKNIRDIDAHFAERTIDMDMTIAASLGYPQIGKIKDSFELKNVKQFTFGELKARIMPNHMRVRTDDYLEDLKMNNWNKYDANRHARTFVRFYSGLLATGLDQRIDQNCSSHQDKGLCVQPNCGYSLGNYR